MSLRPIRVYLEGEVHCYHCGEIAGVLRADQLTPSARPTFLPSARGPEHPIRSLIQIRCPRCGGPTYLGGMETREVFSIEPYVEQPARRGRPARRAPESGGFRRSR